MSETPIPEHLIREKIINPEIRASDIDVEPPVVDGTKMILQRHERYIRKTRDSESDDRLGSLTPESATMAYEQSRSIVEGLLSSLGDDASSVDFLVVGSSTQYEGKGKRSVETAQEILRAIRDVFQERGIDPSQILNNRSKKQDVAEITQMRVDRIFCEWPEYAAFLEEKYGRGTQKFWQAFEEDWHSEERQRFGAEGPREMVERFTKYLHTLSRFSEHYHKKDPGRRLVIWTVSHYDTVSPYVKQHITQTDPNQYLAVDYGSGVSIEIDVDGKASSNFRGRNYPVTL